MRRVFSIAAAVAALAVGAPRAAGACRVIELEFLPTANLQIAIWLERADGVCMNRGPSGTDCVETLFLTRATGTYGIGNRPGMMEFNSGYRWPYGRRTSVLPVWAHARGRRYRSVVFQDGNDRDLAHSPALSSLDPFFCRPMLPDDPREQPSIDATSCATANPETDKGIFDPSGASYSLYPPRDDLAADPTFDSVSVPQFETENDLDAVSSATLDPSTPFAIRLAVGDDLTMGDTVVDFVVRIEVNREFDPYGIHDYPSPTDIAYREYGYPYRGQPSVVWSVPVHVGLAEESWQTLNYAGYGAPDGADGALRPPDATIRVADGSGGGRLLERTNVEGPYRFRATFRPAVDAIAPAPIGAPAVEAVSDRDARISFTSPGDDGMDGNVAGYQFRLLAGTPMSPTNFDRGFAPVLRPLPAAGPAGQIVSFQVGELLPDVQYSLGVRAEDDCANLSELVVIPFRTGSTAYGTVPPCGCSGAGAVAELPLAIGLFWGLSLIRRSSGRR